MIAQVYDGGPGIADPSISVWLFPDQPEHETGTALPSDISDRETTVKATVVLLVEDNRADVLIIEEAISIYALPIELHVVSDGAKAFEFIERAERDSDAPVPQLLLLDLNVPQRSGKEVLQRVRASAKFSKLPVLIISSSGAPRDRKETQELGVSGYFCKPADYDAFLKVGAVLKALLEPLGN